MADFDASRLMETEQAAMDYLTDRHLALPPAHDLVLVIERLRLQLDQERAEWARFMNAVMNMSREISRWTDG